MLDPKFIRENPTVVKEAVKKRGLNPEIVDNFLSYYEEFRKLKVETDSLRHKHNLISEEINKAKKQGKFAEADKRIREAKKILEKIEKNEAKIKEIKPKLRRILFLIQNLPAKNVPEENKVIKIGKIKRVGVFNFISR